MLRGYSVESSAATGATGMRRSLLGLGLAALTLALSNALACAPVTQLHAAASSATQAAAQKPITVTAQLGSATQGMPFSGKIIATGGRAPYHFTIRFGRLPAGLALNPKSGVMDGTPTQAGTSEFTVRASSHDWRELTDLGLKVTVDPKEKQERVTVTVSPATANIPSGATQQLTAVVHGSDDKQIHWSASAGTISTSGLFTAPSVTTAVSATVTATSVEESAKGSSTISITPVASSSLTIATSALPDASQG
jgi:hypothetical protein